MDDSRTLNTFQDGMRTVYSVMKSSFGGALLPVSETKSQAKIRVMYSIGDKLLEGSLIYMKFLPR